MPSEAIPERFDAIFPLQGRLGSARLPVKMKSESNHEQSKASESSSGVAKRSKPLSLIPSSSSLISSHPTPPTSATLSPLRVLVKHPAKHDSGTCKMAIVKCTFAAKVCYQVKVQTNAEDESTERRVGWEGFCSCS